MAEDNLECPLQVHVIFLVRMKRLLKFGIAPERTTANRDAGLKCTTNRRETQVKTSLLYAYIIDLKISSAVAGGSYPVRISARSAVG